MNCLGSVFILSNSNFPHKSTVIVFVCKLLVRQYIQAADFYNSSRISGVGLQNSHNGLES